MAYIGYLTFIYKPVSTFLMNPFSSDFSKTLYRDFFSKENCQCITISPPYMGPNEIEEFHKKIMYIVMRFNFILFPELDDNNRFHYHGIICLYQDIKYTVEQLEACGTFVLIEKIKNHDNWLKYMSKDFFKHRFIFYRLRSNLQYIMNQSQLHVMMHVQSVEEALSDLPCVETFTA